MTTNDKEECDVTYKVLLLGDSGVGKTSLIRSLTGSKFSHNMLTTVGIDFVKVQFEVDGARVRLQIWDTAGQERFRSITRFQYRATKGLLLLYDITNRQSFETLSYWLTSIDKDLDQNNKEPIPVIIVGNKCDLEASRSVSADEGDQEAKKNYATGFFETSAATGASVRECFQHLANAITEINNPELMAMYKGDLEKKKRDSTLAASPTTTTPSSSPKKKQAKQPATPTTIKLTKTRKQHRKCECNS